MNEKQLAGLVDENEKGHIVVEPQIPQEVTKKQGAFQKIFKMKCCRRKQKLKGDADLIPGSSDEANSLLDELSTEVCVKKIDFIPQQNIIIVHSYRKADIYSILSGNTRRIQSIEFEEDPNVLRCFAFNPEQLLFAFDKKIIAFQWNLNTHQFDELDELILRDVVLHVCGNVEEPQSASSAPNAEAYPTGFLVRNTRNQVILLRFKEDKVVAISQTLIEDRGIQFEKNRSFMFYHNSRILLIRWQAGYAAEKKAREAAGGGSTSGDDSKQYTSSKRNLSLKAAVVITFFECNPRIAKEGFFVKQYSHRLDLKEFEVIQDIDEAYILPQMQNGKHRVAVVCMNKTFLLVFGYKDGSYYLDKAAHNKQKLHFDIKYNIIVGVKEDNICEISNFNDSGSYEAVIQATNSIQSIFHSAQKCIDVQENFQLPFDGDSVVSVEKIYTEKGFNYFFFVQEPTEYELEDEDEDGEDEDNANDSTMPSVRNRMLGQDDDEDDDDDEHDHDHSECQGNHSQCPSQLKKQQKKKQEEEEKKKQKAAEKKNSKKDSGNTQVTGATTKKNNLSDKLIFSIYKMKLVTPKEKLRHLISTQSDASRCYTELEIAVDTQRQADIQSAIRWFGFNTEIISMISWEHSKKTYVEVENYLIDTRHNKSQGMLGVLDYKYLKQELRWLISERKLPVGYISMILLHMIEIFARNCFTCTYSTSEQHQKFENLERRLKKIAQLLFTYQKLIVLYPADSTLEKGLEEFQTIWKGMTLQDLFLLVVEKKTEISLIELVNVFKPEIVKNYFTLFYEIRRQLRDKPIKFIFTKIDFLLPLSAEETIERRSQLQDALAKCAANIPEAVLWDFDPQTYEQTLFCEQYAKNCASYSEQSEVLNTIIPNFLANRATNAKKLLYSTVKDVQQLCELKDALQLETTYLKLIKQFTCLFGEADFSLQILDAAINEKGYKNSKLLKKEYISLSLFCVLLYENNQIDIDYEEFRGKSSLDKISQIIAINSTNPNVILCSKTNVLFEKYGSKPRKFLSILQKFIKKTECTPRVFHEIFKCVQNDFDEENKQVLMGQLFEFINEKLLFEHHEYLEEYVDMIHDTEQKEQIQLYSNMARIISNFSINKKIGYFNEFKKNKNESSDNAKTQKAAEDLIEEIIEKYIYNKSIDRQVALDRSMNIIDIKKISHFKNLLLFIQERLLNQYITRSDVESRLLRKLLEFERIAAFKDLIDSTSLTVEDVDRIILLNVRNLFKRYQIAEIKDQIIENFRLLRLKNPTRTQEKAFFKLACMLKAPPMNIDIQLQLLRKKEKFELLNEILFHFSSKPDVLAAINVFQLHKRFSKFDTPEIEYAPYKEEKYLVFLKDYAMKLRLVERIVSIIEILKAQRSPLVSDICYYLITEFKDISVSERKRFTQLGLLECQDQVLMANIVQAIHENKLSTAVSAAPFSSSEIKPSTNSSKDIAIMKANQLTGKDISLQNIKEEDNFEDQSNAAPTAQAAAPEKQAGGGAASRFFSMISSTISGVVGSTSILKDVIKDQLQTKGDLIRILSADVLSPETNFLIGQNEKKFKRALHELFEDIVSLASQKKDTYTNVRTRQIELFCRILTRPPPSEAFYLLALSKEAFELQLIHEIISKLLNNTHVTFNAVVLIQFMLKISIVRLAELPASTTLHDFISSDISKQEIKEQYLPIIESKYKKTDPVRKIFEMYFDALILIKQLHHFANFVTKENEYKFLFDKAFKNIKIGEMVQETGNLEIFEKEPDIFKMEDFNAKELLVSSIVCSLRNSDIEKSLSLFRKLISLNKVSIVQKNISDSKSSVDPSIWIESFRKIFDRIKNVWSLIAFLSGILEENKEIFDSIVDRKAFMLLQSLQNVDCDVDVTKYVKFEQLFINSTVPSASSGNSTTLRKIDQSAAQQYSDELGRVQRQSTVQEQTIRDSLQQINKSEIRSELEEHNVFVLARVLGHFIPYGDSIVYYLFAKKLLGIKEQQQLQHSSTEVPTTNAAVEMMIDRINKVEFLSFQTRKICEKTVSDPDSLAKYRTLILLLGAQEQRLIDSSLSYSKYTSSAYQTEAEKTRKQVSESLYLRMTRQVPSNANEQYMTDSSKENNESISQSLQQSQNSSDGLLEKQRIWHHFESLLSLESRNLLDCSECKSLVTEFLEEKIKGVIQICESASVELRITLRDVVENRVDSEITKACSAAPLRKQLAALLERIQLNMENVQSILFEVMLRNVLSAQSVSASSLTVHAVVYSLLHLISLQPEQKKILSHLEGVLRMELLLGSLYAQDTGSSSILVAIQSNMENISYYTEKHIRDLISRLSSATSITDIIKIKYIIEYLKLSSLEQELVLRVAENLNVNALISLLIGKYLNFEEIDIIDNQVNQAIISAYNQYLRTGSVSQEIIQVFIDNESMFDRHIYLGFILQFLGAAAFRRTPLYKDLFEILMQLAEQNSASNGKSLSSANSENNSSWNTETEFNSQIDLKKTTYTLCTVQSVDDLIISNLIDLANEKKYYDSAKLNYKFQAYPEELSSVPVLLQKLKEDVQAMLTKSNLQLSTMKKLRAAIPEIKKIH